jgi:TetR/AcrR family transcriptional regulator
MTPRTRVKKSSPVRKRNGEATKERLLRAAVREFAAHGFSGARIERIVKAAKSNMKLLYEHFGDKDGLYIAVLERVYGQLRDSETLLDLETRDPAMALEALVRFTYDHFRSNQDFVRLTSGENLLRGKYIKASVRIPERSSPLIIALSGILKRGILSGVFKKDIDALQLYISIVALSCHHLNNRYTLSSTFRTNLSAATWLDERRSHVVEMIANFAAVSSRDP